MLNIISNLVLIISLLPLFKVNPSSQLICAQKKGSIEELSFFSHTLEHSLQFRVYTPPCFDLFGSMHYPVLYLLHGQSFNDSQWDRMGAGKTADRLIAADKIAPLIIIMPQEDNYLEDTKTSRYGEAIEDELISWVDDHFPTYPEEGDRAIGGLSRGAGWAMRIGLSHPNLFGSIGLHSLAQFPGDYFKIPKWRKKILEDTMPRIYMDIGLADFVKDSAKLMEERLTEYSFPHEWHLYEGTHNEEYWSSHMEEYILWYSQGWH